MATRTLTTALLISAASILAACGGPQTTDELLIGEWEMSEPVTITQGGQTITMRDGEVEYNKDGTTEGEMVVQMGEMSFKIESTGTYTLDGMTLTEKATTAEVTTDSSEGIAEQVRAALQNQVVNTPATSTTITSITKDRLTVSDPTTNTVMVFERD